MEPRLRLLTVHAHPDDESSKGAGTVARYTSEGIRCVLVCATGGEEGEILNPAMNKPGVIDRLSEVRAAELAEAVRIIGYARVVMLGYRDSGMPDTPSNANAESFAQADLDEAVGRLVAIIRDERPQVIVTYGDEQSRYPHPDHLKVHAISIPAFERAGDPEWYPEAGDPWPPLKLYYVGWSHKRVLAMHAKFLELGLESPYTEDWLTRPETEQAVTTSVDISGFVEARTEALLAHATQVDPTSKFWFGLPPEAAREVYPMEDYQLARSLVPVELPEDDLFAGVRDRESQRS